MRLILTLIVIVGLVAGPAPSAADNLVEQGRIIYQSGILPDGSQLTAVGAAGNKVIGQEAACVGCHRRSGMGSREGSLSVSPITGPILFARAIPFRPNRPGRPPQEITPLRQDSRAAYDSATLVRAIRDGIDSSGRPLIELMPRYQLDEPFAASLVAYLQQLSAAPVPGLEPDMLRLASIVTPDASALRSQTVVETLTAWAKGGALGGLPINLEIWRLEGAESTWREQLDRFYLRQPPFAIISGAGGPYWAPVSDFCERTTIPCLFPIVDLAASDDLDFYSLYFSTGVPLEARLLSRYLSEVAQRPGRIVQLIGNTAGEAAARQLAASLPNMVVDMRRWRADAPTQAVTDLKVDDLLIGWLDPVELQALSNALPEGLGTQQMIFSAQLAPPEETALPMTWRRWVRWVSVRSDPARRYGNAVIGLIPWAKHLRLPLAEEALLADIYAATYYFGDALARMRSRWNREYLIETLETADYKRAVGGAYFSLSLAAGQREAAKVGHLIGFAEPDYQRITPIGPRLLP